MKADFVYIVYYILFYIVSSPVVFISHVSKAEGKSRAVICGLNAVLAKANMNLFLLSGLAWPIFVLAVPEGPCLALPLPPKACLFARRAGPGASGIWIA